MENFIKKHKALVESTLTSIISKLNTPPILKEAMDYSLQAGGKRIRPLLLFATLQALHTETKKGLLTACSLEMIHTYSLIHDDLPSMDNDDLRRGKPTNHKKFGEANAILAGDGLLTYSFQLLAEEENLTLEQKTTLISMLAKNAGPEGMVGGQVADIQGENSDLSLEEMEYIHLHKTGKLLTYSILAGAVIGNASKKQCELLEQFSRHLGLAFQIRDDILDIEGEQEKMGKSIGSDTYKQKSTYPSLLTLQGAKDQLESHITAAKRLLKETELDISMLEQMTNLIAYRDH